MPSSLDFNLLPIQRQDGQESKNSPGLLMVTPPRRAARGREDDLLVLYLTLTGNAPLPDQQQEQLLTRLAQLYYKTPGSVTLAMRTIADHLNLFLLDRNLNNSNSGRQGIGLLTLAVMRGERLTLGQCGPVHGYLIQPQNIQHLHDPQTAGRGLGLARSISIRYFQTELKPNDVLVLTPQPPSTWKDNTMESIHGQALDSLRRKLISQSGPNINALIILVQGGTGKMRMLHVKQAAAMVQPRPTQVETPPPAPEAPAESEGSPTGVEDNITHLPTPPPVEPPLSTSVTPAPPARTQTAVSTDLPPEDDYDFLLPIAGPPEMGEAAIEGAAINRIEEYPAVGLKESTSRAETAIPSNEPSNPVKSLTGVGLKPSGADPNTSGRFAAPKQPKLVRTRKIFAPISRLTSAIGRRTRIIFTGIMHALARLVKHILPDESMFTIPASTMAFTAIAVAVVIATAGGMMYYQRGRSVQYQIFFDSAQIAAAAAAEESQPLELRTAWESSLYYLDQAEAYKITTESQTLRVQAQRALDDLDFVYRLSYQEAIVGLSQTANITRMAATNNELYMLNANGDNILRATLTGANYEIDPNFQCSPDPTLGNIVDILPLSGAKSSKHLLYALDSNGNYMACSRSGAPEIIFPAPPHTTWKKPERFTLDSGNFYVLDPYTNGVWIYRNMNFEQAPHLYFGEQVPPMRDVVDLAVNRDDLYLLHEDGHLTTCKYSALREAPTRCDDPATYFDSRRGRSNGPIILDARFSQILFTPSPDASIYLLDAINESVYHFSLRLNFQRQFRSMTNLPGDTATAFAVSPNRMIFIATGNQVFFSVLP